MTDLVEKISIEKNKEWLDWKGQVIIDERKEEKNSWLSRNFVYKAIVLKGDFSLGQIVDIEVIEADRSIIGTLVD